jgi:hypothetical protein
LTKTSPEAIYNPEPTKASLAFHPPKIPMKSIKYVSVALAMITLGLQSASAATAYVENGTLTNGATGTAATGIVGFNFTVSSAIDVTQLGFFGSAIGGGDTPWVALYNVSTSTQLAAITTFAPSNGWQYISLGSPVTLNVGSTYQVVATAYFSPKYTDTASFTYGSVINPVGASTFTTPTGWGGWGTPTQATGSLTATPNITANFVYNVSAVPEPSTYAVFAGIATLGFVIARRRRSC